MLQEDRLSLGFVDPGIVQVHMNDRLPVGLAVDLLLLKPYQKRSARNDSRHITRAPSSLVEKQVLSPLKPQKRDRLKLAAAGVLAKQ